ncbi:MAG: hypothetical protein ABJE10_12645 [bacterium]
MTTPADVSPPPLVESRWRHWLRTENLGLGLTLGYLFLTSLGMFHRALVFLMFRINIFDYAEPSDFILAALRDPLIIIVCIAPLPIVSLYFRASYWFQKRSSTSNWLYGGEKRRALANQYRQPLYLLSAALWAIAASLHYASSVAEGLKQGMGRRVHIDLVADTHSTPADTTPALLLGTTQKYVFLYDPARQMTSIIPTGNIARIRVDRKKTTSAAPAGAPAARQ